MSVCPRCLHRIYVLPDQNIFPSVYVGHAQARLVHYLDQLRLFRFAAGREEDYYWAKEQTGHGEDSNTPNVVIESIAYLLKHNLEQLGTQTSNAADPVLRRYREELQKLKARFWRDVHQMARTELGGTATRPRPRPVIESAFRERSKDAVVQKRSVHRGQQADRRSDSPVAGVKLRY